MTNFKGESVSFTGGALVRQHAVITQRPKRLGIIPDDPEVDKLDLSGLGTDPKEQVRLSIEREKFAGQNNGGPTLCMSTGPYLPHPKDPDRAVWAARLACSDCEWSRTRPNVNVLREHIPDQCQNDPPLRACPMFNGKMKADYERADRP